jgi:hypothetical protein
MTSMANLRIPLARAQEQLGERVRLGQELLRHTVHFVYSLKRGTKDEEALWQKALNWHDYNSTRLLSNLGNEVCVEYQAVADHDYGIAIKHASKRLLLEKILPLEISKLVSIRERLPLWATTPETTSPSEDTRPAGGPHISVTDSPGANIAYYSPGATQATLISITDEARKHLLTLADHLERNAQQLGATSDDVTPVPGLIDELHIAVRDQQSTVPSSCLCSRPCGWLPSAPPVFRSGQSCKPS